MYETLAEYCGNTINFGAIYGVVGFLVFVFIISPEIRRINKNIKGGELPKNLLPINLISEFCYDRLS